MIRSIFIWLKNIFIIREPSFSNLKYADYVVDDKGYCVLSWNLNNAYVLKIKSAKYKSFTKSASAYIAIPNHVEQLEIEISGSWRSKKYLMQLQRIKFDRKVGFSVAMKKSFKTTLKIPQITPISSTLKINHFKIYLVQKTQLKEIINISYPN